MMNDWWPDISISPPGVAVSDVSRRSQAPGATLSEWPADQRKPILGDNMTTDKISQKIKLFSAFVTPREKEEWHISSDLYCDMGNGFTDSYNAIIVMLVLKVKSMYISYLFHWSIQYFSLQKIRTSFTWLVVLISA